VAARTGKAFKARAALARFVVHVAVYSIKTRSPFRKTCEEAGEIQFNPDSPSQILIPEDMKWEYAELAKSNKVLPGGGTLMEWELYRSMDRDNARKEHDALQPQRIMDGLNNAEESRASRREQRKALKQAGIDHPRQQRRQQSSGKPNTSELVKKMGKPQSVRSQQREQCDDVPEVHCNEQQDSGGKGSIAERMSKNIQNILDSM
jgi:hypothetical protein